MLKVFHIAISLALAILGLSASAATATPTAEVIDWEGGALVEAGWGGTSGQKSAKPSPHKPRCFAGEKEVSCISKWGRWYQPAKCYLSVPSEPPSPEAIAFLTNGQTGGTVYVCTPDEIKGRWQSWYWIPGNGELVDPGALAQRAVEYMAIQPVRVGIVPRQQEVNPEAIGLVGMPVWMWVEEPSASTFGPTTKTATAGAVSVTATGRVEKIVWDMGDGQQVVCTKPGTPWTASRASGKKASPDCGHVYQKEGRYTVRATTHWRVDWAGAGYSGVLNLTRTSTATVLVGELQVVSVSR